jgi:hypothetical protein
MKPPFTAQDPFRPGKNSSGPRPFTLIELVVTITIIILTVSLVSSTFRKESPVQALERAEREFRAFCARVRYRACESGRDWVVSYDPDEKIFSASPGKYVRFQMPGTDDKLGGTPEYEDEEDSEESEDGMYSPGGTYARLRWKLPENFEFTTENAVEDSLMIGETLEIFRFFPDGGGSGSGHLELRCGDVSRVFMITKLTGRLTVMDKETFDAERNER